MTVRDSGAGPSAAGLSTPDSLQEPEAAASAARPGGCPDALALGPAHAGPPAPPFPGARHGTRLVLFGGAAGLRLAWCLARSDLERGAAGFPAGGGRPWPVLRLARARPGGGAEPMGERVLEADLSAGQGEFAFAVPADHGRYQAEIGLTNETGGWLMLARSNALDNASAVGVALPAAPAVPAASEQGGGSAGGAAGRVVAGLVPAVGVAGPSPGAVREGPVPSAAVAPMAGAVPMADAIPPAETVLVAGTVGVAEVARGADAAPAGGIVRTPGPVPAQVQVQVPAPPAMPEPERALAAVATLAKAEFPLVARPLPPPWAPAPRAPGTSPSWHGPPPLPAVRRLEAPGLIPAMDLAPLAAAVLSDAFPEVPDPQGRASRVAAVLLRVLETRPLCLPPLVARVPGETAPVTAASAPAPVPSAAPGVAAEPVLTEVLWPPTYGQPPVRPGGLRIEAQLCITGEAAPGSLVDLFGFPYRVGPGGRFQLRLGVFDRALIARALALNPPPELGLVRED